MRKTCTGYAQRQCGHQQHDALITLPNTVRELKWNSKLEYLFNLSSSAIQQAPTYFEHTSILEIRSSLLQFHRPYLAPALPKHVCGT